MSHYVIEFYSAKPAWRLLPLDEKQNFFAQVGEAMPMLLEAGIEPLAFGKAKTSIIHAASYDFYAIWKMASEQAGDLLIDAIRQTGWYDYFETVNSLGENTGFAQHMADLIAA